MQGMTAEDSFTRMQRSAPGRFATDDVITAPSWHDKTPNDVIQPTVSKQTARLFNSSVDT